jgi:hypothetical protein
MHLVTVQRKSQALCATDSVWPVLVREHCNRLNWLRYWKISARLFPESFLNLQCNKMERLHIFTLQFCRDRLHRNFPQKWMDCGVPDTWPPGSPDLTAPHNFFWLHTEYCVRSTIAHPLPMSGLRTRNIWTALAYRHDKCRTANGALTEGLRTGKCPSRIWSWWIPSKHGNC